MLSFTKKTDINFMAARKIALAFSITLIVASIISLAVRGLELGIDFTGGTLIEVGYDHAVDLQPIRQILEQGEYGDYVVQHFGSASEVMIRLAPDPNRDKAELSSTVIAALQQQSADVDVRRVDFVGPQVGEELTEDGGLAVLYSLIAILIYVMFRFEYRFSIGAVAALIHDVIITLGLFSFTGIEFDLSVLAAVLAVIGYSLNDTIVVFDRIRENFRKIRKKSAEQVINISLNQTLSRTLMTSMTTLLVLLALFILGGGAIHSFAFALICGIVVGTYSSIFIASNILVIMGVTRKDLLIPEKEGSDQSGAQL